MDTDGSVGLASVERSQFDAAPAQHGDEDITVDAAHHVVHRHDSRVVELGQHRGFVDQARAAELAPAVGHIRRSTGRIDALQGDPASQALVPGRQDDRHPAAADLVEDMEASLDDGALRAERGRSRRESAPHHRARRHQARVHVLQRRRQLGPLRAQPLQGCGAELRIGFQRVEDQLLGRFFGAERLALSAAFAPRGGSMR